MEQEILGLLSDSLDYATLLRTFENAHYPALFKQSMSSTVSSRSRNVSVGNIGCIQCAEEFAILNIPPGYISENETGRLGPSDLSYPFSRDIKVQPVGESQKKQSTMVKIYLVTFVISALSVG
jgi:hypothetical protein